MARLEPRRISFATIATPASKNVSRAGSQLPASRGIARPIEAAGGEPAPKPPRNNYTLQRRIMLALKRDIHNRPHGKLVKRVKYYCDVLLRE